METKSSPKSSNSLSFDQGLLFRQENFPRGRIFRIYPPANSQVKNPQSHNFKIDGISTRHDLLVSNLPIIERAHLQKYNIRCNQKNYSIMLDAPKFIFDAYHFSFENHGQIYNKTHYFAVTPNLVKPEGEPGLPILYRLSVCHEKDNPDHFSFGLYAIAGGYSDGFYFLNRLDNNIAECAHIKKGGKHRPYHTGERKPTPEVIDFPHIHRPDFNKHNNGLQEFNTPTHIPELKNRSYRECLNAYMRMNGICHELMLIQDDMTIGEVITNIQTHLTNQKLGLDTADLGKIALSDLTQYEAFAISRPRENDLPTQECGAPYLKP